MHTRTPCTCTHLRSTYTNRRIDTNTHSSIPAYTYARACRRTYMHPQIHVDTHTGPRAYTHNTLTYICSRNHAHPHTAMHTPLGACSPAATHGDACPCLCECTYTRTHMPPFMGQYPCAYTDTCVHASSHGGVRIRTSKQVPVIALHTCTASCACTCIQYTYTCPIHMRRCRAQMNQHYMLGTRSSYRGEGTRVVHTHKQQRKTTCMCVCAPWEHVHAHLHEHKGIHILMRIGIGITFHINQRGKLYYFIGGQFKKIVSTKCGTWS